MAYGETLKKGTGLRATGGGLAQARGKGPAAGTKSTSERQCRGLAAVNLGLLR